MVHLSNHSSRRGIIRQVVAAVPPPAGAVSTLTMVRKFTHKQHFGRVLSFLQLVTLIAAESGHPRQRRLVGEDLYVRYWQGAVLPPNSTDEGGGCLSLPGFLPPGDELRSAADNVQPTFEACCRTCRDLEGCNAFFFCALEGGCATPFINSTTPFQGCGLVWQAQSAPATARPTVATVAPGFMAGAPIRFTSLTVEGYAMFPGAGFFGRYEYGCQGSLDAANTTCQLKGTPQEQAPRCNSDPNCRGMSFYPVTTWGYPLIVLKGGPEPAAINVSEANLNPNTVVYIKEGPGPPAPAEGSGGGMSTGVVAGIVVGACCGLAMAAAGGFLLWRRRRRRRRPEEQCSLEKVGVAEPGDSMQGDSSKLTKQPSDSAQEQHAAAAAVGAAALPAVAVARRGSSGGSASPLAPQPQNMCGGLPATPPSLPSSPLGQLSTGEGQATLGSPQSSMSSELLLSRLPSDGWASCVMDFSNIQFCRNADGSYVQLGKGAFATVYRVLMDGVSPYAAKVLELGDDQKLQEDFLKEASLLRQLRHRGIVGFAGVCVLEGKGIILMELMEGRDLHSRLHTVNKAGERTFGWYHRGKTAAMDVARALHYLHYSHHLTHFDIKSSNVLLTRDLTAKLADVGLSRAMRHTHHSLSARAGTFDYMAPELLMGRQCTSAVDIYSFGILLWELCTGEYPSRGCIRALQVPRECPQEVADLFLQCVDEDPSKRPTARDLVRRLSQAQH